MEHIPKLFKTHTGQDKYMAAYDAALELWPVPYESFFVTTQYGQTHVISCGLKDASPLVLLHAGHASSTMWFPNISALSKSFKVLAFDTIGEPGKSVPTRQNASRSDLANWLVGVFDELGIEKARVVGLSRGGWLALNLALQASQRVERIVLLSPASCFMALNSFFSIITKMVMRIPTRNVAKVALKSWVTPGFVFNELFAEQFITALQNWNWAVNNNGYSGIMPSVFDAEELGRLQTPVLLLIGDQDRLNPPKVLEIARQMMQRVDAEIVQQAGHFLPMEQPELVSTRMLRFLCSN